MTSSTGHVIGASALGTLFEWYDFYLYGALASTFAAHFFSGVNETTAFIFALATFAVGFIVRPLGALIPAGSAIWSAQSPFLVTLAIMGLSTFLVGVLLTARSASRAAPAGDAADPGVSRLAAVRRRHRLCREHAPAGRRGLHMSFHSGHGDGGLLLSLVVIGRRAPR
jgi:MFS family permease